jgi:hypothetical protein
MRTFFVLLASVASFGAALCTPACTNSSGSSSGGSSGTSSGDDGGSGDGAGGSSSGGGADGGAAGALPLSTFLYVSKVDATHDILMAVDATTGEARTVTDLRGDGSDGWQIEGYALSPDRTRIVMASLYGPTKEDNDTKLATSRIWTLASDGSDFRRLTPVFENTSGGRSGFAIEIRDPMFSKDGSDVFFNYGEYWYESTTLKGASGIWHVGTGGGALPELFKAPSPCSLLDPSVDPKTGKITITHSVCIPGQGVDGIYLYAADGSGEPELLFGDQGTTSVVLETPRWVADGSGFVFIATTEVPVNDTTRNVRGLYVFDMSTRKASAIVQPEDQDAQVIDATIAPDASAIVYCLQQGDATDLHAIDLSVDPPTDTAITNDGKSCHPVW